MIMESENIKKLESLVPKLSDMVLNVCDRNHHVEYNVENGFCIGFPLLNNDKIAIQRAFISKGTYFGEHKHEDSVEIFVIFKGEFKLLVGDNEEILEIGDCARVEKNTLHDGYAIDNTEMICITVPSEEGYPNV